MKRIVPLLLLLLLLVGCAGTAGPVASAAVRATPEATSVAAPETASVAAPEIVPVAIPGATSVPVATPAPRALGPFLYYCFYDQPEWGKVTSAVIFSADLDQDGVEEPVSFALRPDDEFATAIAWGESTVVLEEGDEFVSAAVLDLDTSSPFYNLLVVIDAGSDSYVTIELHPENGQLRKGTVIDGGWTWAEDALWFEERTDFLGTAFGVRSYSGDDLVPDSEWLEMSDVPTAEELETRWESMVDVGVLLHTVLPVPCTVDGQPSLIPADSYVYRLRFRADDDLTEVCLPDGTVALIACAEDEDGWPYMIDGKDMSDYFDNLFFAD